MQTKSELYKQLNDEREEIYKKVIEVFSVGAVEAHVFGSIARGTSDSLSDIDIWFTFKDEDFEKVRENRLENYKKVGNLLQFVEPPQNAPINGVCSSLRYLTDNENIQVVDIYLCPISTSIKNPEAKKLFGFDLPVVENTDYNPQKVEVDSDYGINFFSSFIFGTIKKLARHNENPLEAVLTQYEKLGSQYGYKIEKLSSKDQNLNTLLEIIENTKTVANPDQQYALEKIAAFADKVLV
jgi:predicted nucleotidyltransferase